MMLISDIRFINYTYLMLCVIVWREEWSMQ